MTAGGLKKLLVARASFHMGIDPVRGQMVPGYMVWLTAEEMREIDEMEEEQP